VRALPLLNEDLREKSRPIRIVGFQGPEYLQDGREGGPLNGNFWVCKFLCGKEDRQDDVARGFGGCASGFAHCTTDCLHDIHLAPARVSEGDSVQSRHVDALGEAAGVGDQVRPLGLCEPRQCLFTIFNRH